MLKTLRNSSIFRNVLKVSAGNIIAHGIGVLSIPILTRLYDPGAFGMLGLYLSITGILSVVSCGRYELAIVLPQDDTEAASILWLSLLIAMAAAILTFLLAIFTGELIGRLFKRPEIIEYLWLAAFSILGIGSYLSMSNWLIRKKRFGRLGVTRVIQATTNQGAKLTMGFAAPGNAGGLIAGKVISDIVTGIYLCFLVVKDDLKHALDGFSWKMMKNSAVRYRKFPLFDSWSILFNSFSQSMPVFVLAFFFVPESVGFYVLGFQVLTLPVGIMGKSIAQVYFQEASNAVHGKNLDRITESFFNRLVLLGVFPIFSLMIIGPELFTFIFGAEWREAGEYVRILSPWFFFIFISSPLSAIFIILEKQERLFLFNVVFFFTRLLFLLWGGMVGNLKFTLMLLSLTSTVMYLWLSLWNLNSVGIKSKTVIRTMLKYIMISLPECALLAVAKIMQLKSLILIIIAIAGYGLFLTTALWFGQIGKAAIKKVN